MKYLLITCLAMLTFAAGDAADAPAIGFQAGDRWAAIGDSITHGRRYHSFVYLFHATRYPDRPFTMNNCGISGDSAAGAVQRFEWDIAVHKPTVATIMLGMNDVSRGLYAPGQTGAAVETRREDALKAHFAAMEQLTEKLKAISCRIIYITPSIYDQTGNQQTENCSGVNDALGLCGENAKKMAERTGGGLLELHRPMTALNAELQKANPNATLVGPDRVHPGDPGQLVMAYYLLKGLGVSGTVAEFTVDAAAGKATIENNCSISDVKCQGGKAGFVYTASSLPYPVLPAAEEALKWVPFMQDLNREIVKVTGLPDGSYAVRIDGVTVATTVSARELAAGINLAGNPLSPMLKQAQKVMDAEEKRQSIAARMRTFAAQRHFLVRSNPGLDPDDFEAMKAALLADLEKKKGAGNFGYFKGQVDTYITWKPREAELKKEMDERTADVWRHNKPVAHRFEIEPATAENKPASAAQASKDIDSGEDAAAWQKVSWTDCTPTISVVDGSLVVSAPRTAGHRDMLGISKPVKGDLAGVKNLRIRYKADKGAPFGVEVNIDGKLIRLRSYEKATGDWEDLSLPVAGKNMTSVSLLLNEGGKDEVWAAPTVTYMFDRIWLE
ncbi:MAG: SGNH/GDSL hydrolase family protein [Spirochaetes bacterium]|nr:SGNH/GDSL hydrolase family protein [Spirochaetota bacterium]